MDAFLIVFIVAALLEWISEYRKSQRLIYFSKPVALLSLIGWVWVRMGVEGASFTSLKFGLNWFVIGLVLCLVGDIFLMLPVRFFMPGLVAFLFGHVAYIVGFSPKFPPDQAVVPGWIVIGMVGLASVSITRKLVIGLQAGGKRRLIGPIVVYAGVITVMLYGAITTLLVNNWHFLAALPVSVGAAFFYVSDVLNAWDRFIVKLPKGRLTVMILYHLGQAAIAIGAVSHFLYKPDS